MLNNSSSDNSSRVNAGTGDANGGYYLQLPFGFTVFQLSLQVAIGVFGVTGNVLVCATIMRRTNKLSALSPYLLSLAFADLGILLFNHPLAVLKIQFPYGEWLLGKVVCLYIAPFTETFFGASIWTITAIAVERYIKIAWKIKKIHFVKTRSLKRTRFIIIAIWVISFAVTSIPLYLYSKYNSESKTKYCNAEFSFTFRRNLITINAIVLYVLPLSIIAFSYQRISKRICQRSNSLLDETPIRFLESSRSNARAILLQTRKTQRILKPLVILFAVTMLPLHLFTLTFVYWGRNYHLAYQSYFFILFTIVDISVSINAAADPLVYCAVNKDFRQEIIAVLNCCFRCQLTKSRGSRNSFRSTGRSRGTVESKVLEKDETELQNRVK